MSHVSQLKQHVPDHSTVFSKFPSAAELDISEVSPAAILDRRLFKKGNTALLQVFSSGLSLPEKTTWEDYANVQAWFPTAAQGMSHQAQLQVC